MTNNGNITGEVISTYISLLLYCMITGSFLYNTFKLQAYSESKLYCKCIAARVPS